MGYSTNRDRLIQLLPYMSLIIQRQDCFWNLEGRKTSAAVFAYRLREALYIAKLHAPEFAGVAAVADDCKIETKGSMVYASFGKTLTAPLPQAISELANSMTQLSHETGPQPITYTLETIEALWSKRRGPSINLPMYVPTDAALHKLYLWGKGKEPVVMLMPSDNALTLIEFDPELEGMEWEPTDMGASGENVSTDAD